MKRHLSDSEPELLDGLNEDYDECSSPDTAQVISRKKRRGIIEKRRRDRINSCLVELRRLVPAAFEKQGSAKLEKAEILQMTVDHLRHLHQCRDPRGYGDSFLYGNTRAFLDYRVMGFRECVTEAARFLATVEGVDNKDPQKARLLSHLENYLAQRELAINTAVAASAQVGLPRSSGSVPLPTSPVSTGGLPCAPIMQTRMSPNHLSSPVTLPEAMPRFYPTTPIISFASTAAIPVFGTAASCFTNPRTSPINLSPAANKADQPPTPPKQNTPTSTTKAPFRPWANTVLNTA